jgi:dTDP-4-amino-4,6-dideoxygalactose transaminase
MLKKIDFWKVKFDPNVTNLIKKNITNQNISQGRITEFFEKEVSKKLNINYCVMTNNGSVALLMSLFAIGLKKNDEVIVQDRTWVSIANAISIIGAKIKLVDVDEQAQIIDLNKLEKLISNKTKALIITHMNGNSIDMDKIKFIKKKYKNLKIIEDASQAFLSKFDSKFLGTFGDLGCFSLSIAKLLSTGQGGFVVTNKKEYYNFLKFFRSHSLKSNKEIEFKNFGFNFRFNDILATFGLYHLKKINSKINKINYIYQLYINGLKNCSKISIIKKTSNQTIPIYIEAQVDDRDRFYNFMKKRRIEIRKFYNSLSSINYIKKIILNKNFEFTNSKKFEKNGIYLPSGPNQEMQDIKRVINLIKEYDLS